MDAPPLNIHLASLDDPEPWVIEQQMFDILVEYLDPNKDVSPVSAAQAFNKLAPPNREVRDAEEVEGTDSFLLETWGNFLIIAKQIDHSHPAQDRLVNLMIELGKLPPVEVEISGDPMLLWSDFPMLASEVRDKWGFPHADDPESLQQWENLNAFTARLTTAGLLTEYHFGSWTLMEALEEPWDEHAPPPQPTLIASNIRAAALWIELARHTLYDQVPITSTEDDGVSTEFRYFSEKKWQLWTKRFSEIAETEGGAGDEATIRCRVLAARVSGMMTEMSVARERAMQGQSVTPQANGVHDAAQHVDGVHDAAQQVNGVHDAASQVNGVHDATQQVNGIASDSE